MLRKCRIAQSKFRSGSGRKWKSSSGPVPTGTQKHIPVHPYSCEIDEGFSVIVEKTYCFFGTFSEKKVKRYILHFLKSFRLIHRFPKLNGLHLDFSAMRLFRKNKIFNFPQVKIFDVCFFRVMVKAVFESSGYPFGYFWHCISDKNF